MSCSAISLLWPYGLSGCNGARSPTGRSVGLPYTEQEPENTNERTALPWTASSRRAVATTLFSKYLAGTCIDSPAFL